MEDVFVHFVVLSQANNHSSKIHDARFNLNKSMEAAESKDYWAWESLCPGKLESPQHTALLSCSTVTMRTRLYEKDANTLEIEWSMISYLVPNTEYVVELEKDAYNMWISDGIARVWYYLTTPRAW